MAGEDEIEGGNRDDEQLHYNPTNLPSDWPFNNPNELTNTSMSMVSTIWDHNPTNSQNLGAFCDMNLQNNPTTSASSLGFRKGNLDMCWVPPNSAVKRGGSMFIPPAASALLPHSLSQFPADSGFIERAARLSSFSAGNFEDMMNPFGNVPESSLSPYSSRAIQGQPQEGFVGNGFKSVSGDGSKDMPLPVDCGADGSHPKQGGSGFSGNNCNQDENSNEGTGSKKRRRSDQVYLNLLLLLDYLLFKLIAVCLQDFYKMVGY